MEGETEQVIVMIQESEDGPSDETVNEIEHSISEIFDSDATVNPCGGGMIAVNVDDPLVTARELTDTVNIGAAYGVTDYVVTTVTHVDNVQEMLNG
jgi:hypothetical protein